MGLFDGILGSVLGSSAHSDPGQAQNPLIQIALQMLQQNGGVSGRPRQVPAGGIRRPRRFLAEHRAEHADLGFGAAGSPGLRRRRADRAATRAVARRGRGRPCADAAAAARQAHTGGEVPEDHDDMVAQALALLTKSKPG